MAVKLIGADIAGDTGCSSGYILYVLFTCGTTGSCTSLKLYCRANSNARVAIYSNHTTGGDHPESLIVESTSQLITQTGWKGVTITGTDLTAGAKYWLAFQVATAGGSSYTSVPGGGCPIYCNQAYTYGVFPASATGGTQYTTYDISVAGWGTAAGGWANIAEVSSVAAASIAERTGVALASIAEISGVAV
jgi:hypothetical protein